MRLIELIQFVLTTIFLLYVISYYILLFIKRKPAPKDDLSSLTIIIPARNEEPYIDDCIKSVLAAKYDGDKQVIVVNDASIDNTAKIIRKYPVKLINNNKQLGKSASLNKALKQVNTDLVAVVDADSMIEPNSLKHMREVVAQKNFAGATGVVKVANRNKIINYFTHLEQLYNSLIRELLSKIGANITTPGPLSMYRTKSLKEIGGFSTEGFSEDVDVTIRLIRAGYKVGFSSESYALTNLPADAKGFFRQRTRFARGMINIIKRHLRAGRKIIDWYTMPLLLFMYLQSAIMGSITLAQMIIGYHKHFLSKETIINLDVARFFFDWFSIVGFMKWVVSTFSKLPYIDILTIIAISVTLLSYPLFCYAIIKYDKKIDFKHVIGFVFMPAFWLLITIIYIICLPEMLRRKQYNIWKKNEP